MNSKILAIVLVILIISACSQPESPDQKSIVKEPALPLIPAPEFNSDSAYLYTEEQVAFGPRVPNSAAHDSCAIYIKRKLNSFGIKSTSQTGMLDGWDGAKLKFENITGSINPTAKTKILLFAHWDTRPYADREKLIKTDRFDGASDGASGVAVLLEIARLMAVTKSNIGVDVVFFDLEDYGNPKFQNSYCLGAQYWARNLPSKDFFPKYGILLDMVGAKNAKFAMEAYSMQFAPHIVNRVWKKAAAIGYSDYFIFKRISERTDDHLYVNKIAQIPCIDIIQYDPTTSSGFGDYWHTKRDNMEIIDRATLKAVGQTLLEVLYSEK